MSIPKNQQERVALYLFKTKRSQVDIGREMGVVKQTVYKIAVGKITSGENVRAFCKVVGCTEDWLRDGTGDPPVWAKDEYAAATMADVFADVVAHNAESAAIIQVDEHTTAGTGKLDQAEMGGSQFTQCLFIKPHWRAVAIHGTSAEPVALDGQHVLVDDNLEAKDGRIVCVTTTDGRFFCKRWCDAGGDHVVLAGLNAGIESVALHRDEIARARVVVGVVFTDSVAR